MFINDKFKFYTQIIRFSFYFVDRRAGH